MFKRMLLFFTLLLYANSLRAAESDTYNFSWLDQDKEVYVLQNRKFRKVDGLHFNIGYGTTTSGAFVDAKMIQGRVSYYFLEDWGFQFLYSKNEGEENITASSVRRNSSGTGSIPFRRIVDNYMGVMGVWSPFYSKINSFNKIIYVDWLIGLGFAKLEETNNRRELETGGGLNTPTTENHNGAIWDVGAIIYLSRTWNVRLDLTGVHYRAQESLRNNPQEIWYENFDFTVSAGLSF